MSRQIFRLKQCGYIEYTPMNLLAKSFSSGAEMDWYQNPFCNPLFRLVPILLGDLNMCRFTTTGETSPPSFCIAVRCE
eukprot:1006038-Amphidinium_carterae.1